VLGVFIAWKRLSRRTEDLARELGLELAFIRDSLPYARAIAKTLSILYKNVPKIVFVQLPQGPLLAETAILSRFLKFRTVADVHTGFIYTTTFKEMLLNRPFYKYLRYVELVLAHNVLERELIVKKTGAAEEKVMIVYDPLPSPPHKLVKPRIALDFSKSIVLPASWSPDEPIDRVVEEFLKAEVSKEHTLVVTGNYKRNVGLYNSVARVVERFKAKSSVVLTGFMLDEEYWYLLKNCKAVIVLTNREYTLPHAMWESVTVQKPSIVAKTRTLELELGSDYPCFFNQDLSNFAHTLDSCIAEKRVGNAVSVAEKLALKSRQSIEKLKNVVQGFA